MKEIKCGNCGEKWKVVWLCPVCQNEIIEHHEKTGEWRCLICNSQLWLSVDSRGHLIGLVCPTCQILYLFLVVKAI